MNPLFGLCRLGRQVVLTMAWFVYKLLFSRGFLRSGRIFLRYCVKRWLTPIVGVLLLAIGWRQDRGDRDVPEIRDGNGPEATGFPEGVEEPRCEGQHEAAARKGAAAPGQSSQVGEEDEDFDGDEYRVETTDEFYCGYDSTWETEEGPSTSRRQPAASMRVSNRAVPAGPPARS